MTAAVAGAAAFVLGLAGGITLALDAAVSLPRPVGLAALTAVAASVLLAAVCVFADARREGTGPARSLGRTLRTALAWCAMLLL